MILVDTPLWPAHGRLWAHLVSDVSYAELHAFAEMLGAPRRGFDRELAARLRTAGLRRPKHLNR